MNNGSSDRMDRIDATLDRITERLDRLTERHQALAESVEMHDAMLTRLEKVAEENSTAVKALQNLLGEAAGHINALARIAESHDRRLEKLEG